MPVAAESQLAGVAPPAKARPGDRLGGVGDSHPITAVVTLNGQVPVESVLRAAPGASATFDDSDEVIVTGPAGDIRALLDVPGVEAVERAHPFHEMVTSEGLPEIGTTIWHDDEWQGDGVKVAIVDTSFDGYTSLLGTELPSSVTAVSFRGDNLIQAGSAHGTGVAEIVHDIAPNAQYYLLAADTETSFQSIPGYVISQGIDVVNMSIGLTVGPFDGSSFVSQQVDSMIDAGVTVIVSAGNTALRHWSGPGTDTTGEGWVEFSGSTELNEFFVAPFTSFVVDITWVDSNGDFDLCVWEIPDVGDHFIVDCDSTPQPPAERDIASVLVSNGSASTKRYAFSIFDAAGTGGRIDAFVAGASSELLFGNVDGSIVDPAVVERVITVGAYSTRSPLSAETFSAQGPTVDGRTKPDILAPNGVSTATFGLGGFFGTSAAAPHTAGLAVLATQAAPGMTPDEVRLELGAIAGGAKSNALGWGALHLDVPPIANPTDTFVGDFDGDGDDDMATYSEANGRWMVGVSSGSGFTMEHWATFGTKTGWGPQLVGDFTGDGRDDIVSYHEGTGRWWVNRSTGSAFVLELWAEFSTKSGWSNVMVGDFNGDGRDDIVSYYRGLGRWWVNRSTGSAFALELWATFSTKSGWSNVRVGDFSGDGLDDVVAYYEGLGRWWVNHSTGSGFALELWATFSTKSGWSNILVGDFTGDGLDDLVAYYGGLGRWWVNTSTGSSFTLGLWATFSTTSGWSPVLAGDFTGDGLDDVVAYYEGLGRWWVNRSTGSGFALELWSTFSTTSGWSPVVVGDFTSEGRHDVLAYHQASGRWWVNLSSGADFTLGFWADYSSPHWWDPV